ncbi:MAG: substrate-binding domain-containing protein [Gaiellaceae bacterium]
MRLVALAALALLCASCAGGGGGGTTAPAVAADDRYVVGVSSTRLGDAWHEQLICSVKAEALASGKVAEVLVDDVVAGPERQAAGIRNLVTSGADAIVLVASDPTALDAAIAEATGAGAVVVAVDRPVTSEDAYVVMTDQIAYGRLGMEWLSHSLGGAGQVLVLREEGDDARRQGIALGLASLTVVEQQAAGMERLAELDVAFDAVWAPGPDYAIVDALAELGRSEVPVVGTDNNEFLRQLRDGAEGAAVTDPAAVGGVGTAIALDVLEGLDPPRQTLLTPEVWTWPEDREAIERYYDPSAPPAFSALATVEPFTHYTPDQVRACQAP